MNIWRSEERARQDSNLRPLAPEATSLKRRTRHESAARRRNPGGVFALRSALRFGPMGADSVHLLAPVPERSDRMIAGYVAVGLGVYLVAALSGSPLNSSVPGQRPDQRGARSVCRHRTRADRAAMVDGPVDGSLET